MSLRLTLRGLRAPTTIALTAALALTPAVAAAAAPNAAPNHSRATLREAPNKRPAAGRIKAIGYPQVSKRPIARAAAVETGLGNRAGLGPTMQLAAISTAIAASPTYWAGHETGCNAVTPILASQPGTIMAGNFRDSGGNCYVWINLQQSTMLTGSEICKTALHEMGHLNGLQHSTNPLDVMYAPFQADPIPAACQAPPAPAKVAKVKSAASRAKTICPPGAANADYCQSAPQKKAKAKGKKK